MMSWTKGLGITKSWDAASREEVTAHSRELWGQMKERNGWSVTMPGRDIPGFFECLQEMYDGGYSFTDIASVFGMSRERIRQLFNKEPRLRFTDTGSLYRYWDPEAERFMPVKPEAIRRRWYEFQKRRRWQRGRARRRARVIQLQGATRELGHIPPIGELVAHTGRALPDWSYYWRLRFDGRKRSYTVALDRLYRSAGYTRPDDRGKSKAAIVARQAHRRLAPEQVRMAWRLAADGVPKTEIARRLNVSDGTIWSIGHRRTYRDGTKGLS